MLDFLVVSTRRGKDKTREIYPRFMIVKSKDLMIRGNDFYAIWDEGANTWRTDEQDAVDLIDQLLDAYKEENEDKFGDETVRVLHMRDAQNGMIDQFHKYCKQQMRDNFHSLDENLVFSNTDVKKEDYSSKCLPYPLEPTPTESWDRLLEVLYAPEEQHKIEWCIGSIVTGDSKRLQKFMVLYGAAGTGKSTILNIIQMLFDGYYCVFDARALGSSSNSFALEAFKANPLVAIQHDGDLSRIEDNTRLNSVVSHELMTVNEKFKTTYSNRFQCFLFMGTNKPVKITDAKSGLIRRLIDVSPTGETLKIREYNRLMKSVTFELGGIASKCKDVYLSDPDYYDNYTPIRMLGASNDFYNFMEDSYYLFKHDDSTTLKAAWAIYKQYCEEARVSYPLPMRLFAEELKNYFDDYKERGYIDGVRVRGLYQGFLSNRFQTPDDEPDDEPYIINFEEQPSIFDKIAAKYPAQYATEAGTPKSKWINVKTTLDDIDTKQLHYVKVPENHIVIDFDLVDANGNKDFEKNLKAASKWPKTYAELSKSGSGIHLHYIYSGDVTQLRRVYDDHIEIKVYTGDSSLRRMLSKCNREEIAMISSGLPLKEKKMINTDTVTNERKLRSLIIKNLNKEIHAATKPSIDFINKLLTDAYESGMHYDVTDLRNAVIAFAAGSTNQSPYCMKLVSKMHFKSEDVSLTAQNKDELVFYDVEVFPNLFLVNWKVAGKGKPVTRMINPTSADVEEVMGFKLVGFNCRRYDNHIMYACLMGYNNQQLYELSKKIIEGDSPNRFFSEAYNISYTDVYDFCSKKQGLKKWEIELGIHHKELGLPWDEPVPESRWLEVAEYCDNDVLATEAVFDARQSDFTARKMLAELADGTVNDTTNTLTSKIIFGNNRTPQTRFNYRNMGEGTVAKTYFDDEYTAFDRKGRPIFPGYKYEMGVSTYRGIEVGEGGFVYSEPGMYQNVVSFDVSSMHPASIIAENLFGDEYTSRFKDLRDARIAIKHGDTKAASTMLNGALKDFLGDDNRDLSYALKIAINSVYGQTAAHYKNPFKDDRNVDNIVAKRGALFMINLLLQVKSRGYQVCHIKTDSIKIVNPSPEISNFIVEYGKLYGYDFEVEHVFEKFCLINDAVYVGKLAQNDPEEAGKWVAVGARFQVPYVFKTLFSHEPITFDDYCETKSVQTSIYLDQNEGLDEDTHNYVFVGRVGRFTPVVRGVGGGLLMRSSVNGKYGAVTGTKGYRWMESETVKQLGLQSSVDKSYYTRFVDEAVAELSKFGDVESFID